MVRPKVVEVPIGSLLIVKALTVTANAPTLLDGAAVKVRVDVPSRRGVAGVNDAVTWQGRPLTLRFTRVSSRRRGAWNEMLVVVEPPGRSVAEVALSRIV